METIDEEMWADVKKHLQEFAAANFIQVDGRPNSSTIIRERDRDNEGGGRE